MSRSGPGETSPSSVLKVNPAVWRWGRAIRAALSMGLPFAVGLMAGDIMTGMWIAMGCLMMITAESYVPYRQVLLTMLVSAPIGALGYLAGYLAPLPWSLVVIAMMVAGLACGILSSLSHALPLGALQFLLLVSIAIGVPLIAPFWPPAALYLAVAVLYALLLAIEILVCGWQAQDARSQNGPAESPQAAIQPNTPSPVAQALALALCLGVAYGSHWFWIRLTVGLLMKPDPGPVKGNAKHGGLPRFEAMP